MNKNNKKTKSLLLEMSIGSLTAKVAFALYVPSKCMINIKKMHGSHPNSTVKIIAAKHD